MGDVTASGDIKPRTALDCPSDRTVVDSLLLVRPTLCLTFFFFCIRSSVGKSFPVKAGTRGGSQHREKSGCQRMRVPLCSHLEAEDTCNGHSG